MKKIFLLIVAIAALSGCATQYQFIKPSIQKQPESPVVKGELWTLKDKTGKVIDERVVFTKAQWFIIEQVIGTKNRYMQQCEDLIGPQK
jgi:hypothetical protein